MTISSHFSVMAFDKRSLQYYRWNVNIIVFLCILVLLRRFSQTKENVSYFGEYRFFEENEERLMFFFNSNSQGILMIMAQGLVWYLIRTHPSGGKTYQMWNIIKIRYEEWFAQCVQLIALYAINHQNCKTTGKKNMRQAYHLHQGGEGPF